LKQNRGKRIVGRDGRGDSWRLRDFSPAAQTDGANGATSGQTSAGSGSKESEKEWTLENLTTGRIELHGSEGLVCVLPPYGCRTTTQDPYQEFADLAGKEGLGEVEVRKKDTPPSIDYSLLSLWVLIVPIAVAAGSGLGTSGWVIGSIAFLIPPLIVGIQAAKSRKNLRGVLGGLPAWALQALAFLVVLTFASPCLL
jgi:hypothetical protein